MSASRDQLNEYLKQIDITGKVCLDIGVQDKPTRRLTKGEPLEYDTLDVDREWDATFYGDLCHEWDYDTPSNLPEPNEKLEDTQIAMTPEYYDTVFCIEVLEHCWNPIQALQNIHKVTAKHGTVYISTPFINPHHDYWDYMRFTGEWYEKALKHVGFKEVIVKERVATKGRGLLEAFYKIEGLRVSKIRPEYGKYTYPIGYFVEAKK